jgi:hypothetical protein
LCGEMVSGTDITRFSYILDNKSFTKIGNEMQMQFKLIVFTEKNSVFLITL